MSLRFSGSHPAALFLAALLGSGCGTAGTLPAAGRQLHERIIVLDSHLDTPANLARPGWDIMPRHSYVTDLSQVDYPRMVEGGLDGGFWVIFTDPGPLTAEAYAKVRDGALKRTAEIREMVARNHEHFELALKADDAAHIAARGKRIVFQSIENSYPLGNDITLLKTFYDFGARMVGPVHVANNQFADSSTDKEGKKWGGLSPLGVQLVHEANRLGMILDASHASDDVLDQMLSLSKTPIILSHSGLKIMSPHPRNIDDDQLRRLAAKGGVLQLVAVDFFLSPKDAKAREGELIRLLEKYGPIELLPAEKVKELARETQDMDIKFPPKSSLDDYMRQMFHAIEVAGVDHVGLGVDWDGGGGVPGLNEVSQLPEVTARLRKAGYSEDDIAKIMGGNLLRVLRAAEAYARSQQPPA